MGSGFLVPGAIGPVAMAAAGGALPELPNLAGLQLWLKADAITGINDGDAISIWPDSSGNGRNASRSLGTILLKNNIVNGKPVVRFNSDFSTMSFTEFLSSNISSFVVHSKATGSSNIHLLSHGSSYQYLHYGSLWYIVNATMPDVMSSGVFYIKTVVSQVGPIANGWSNGVLRGTVAERQNGFDRIGLPGFPGPQGDIAEIIIYNSALSDADRQAVEAYLSAKYGIALT